MDKGRTKVPPFITDKKIPGLSARVHKKGEISGLSALNPILTDSNPEPHATPLIG